MSLSLFIARRIYAADDGHRQVGRPAVRIATAGVAIGLAVMIVTVSVVLGFKHTIRDKIAGFGSHVQVSNLMAWQTGSTAPVCISDSLMTALRHLPNVSHVDRYTLAQGILKTDDDFMGVAFKGIGSHYDTSFLRESMREGQLPAFSDSASTYRLLVSRKMADQLRLKVGDRVFAYFIVYSHVKARRFTVSGIYETDMRQFDDVFCFTDYQVPVKVNEWEADQCSGAEIRVADFDRLEETAGLVARVAVRQPDRYGVTLASQSVYESYPQVFSWLSLLDINVWVILVLMVCVAGFTMISGLLIIILERTQMIGLLKALGARNGTIRRTFLWFAVFVIGRGLFIGDVVGIALVLLQRHLGIVRLDPASYYVDVAPVELSLPLVLLLNVVTLLACVFVLVAPSYLVSHIHPARTIHFE